MKSDGDYLLRSVIQEPFDDTIRLVYCDWLEENGREQTAKRIRNAVKKGDKKTGSRMPSLVTGYIRHYWRGFISGLTCTFAVLQRHRRDIFKTQPIVEVYIQGINPIRTYGLTGDWYLWTKRNNFDVHGNEPHCLPDEIFDRPEVGKQTWKTDNLARAAVSLACVNFHREHYGFRPLSLDEFPNRYAFIPILPTGFSGSQDRDWSGTHAGEGMGLV